MARHFYPTVDLECGRCKTRFEANVAEVDPEQGFTCPSCGEADPEQHERLMKGLVALSDAVELDGTFAVNGVHFTNKPRLARVEEPPDDDAADEPLERIERLLAAGKATEAFIAALSARGHPAAERLVESAWCSHCRTRPVAPDFSRSGAAYARYWRGHCPECDRPLLVGRRP